VPAQPGIFALGTTDHCYLELELRRGQDDAQRHRDAAAVVSRLVGTVAELGTTAGVDVVLGVRPSLWTAIADPAHVPDGVQDWTDDLVGPDGFTMPATQCDLWVWIAGSSRSAVFDGGRTAVDRTAGLTGLCRETTGWVYRHDRDLTGFIDGTENPSLVEAPAIVATPAARNGAGASVLLFQLWQHDTARWAGEPTDVQERAMGRTKAESVELDPLPADAHVARTVIEVDGEELDIFRRNVAYGELVDHGTVFVGFSHDQWRMAEMLRRMAGIPDGVRCTLTRYLTPLTGAYYVVPSVEALSAFAPPEPS
jgi:putative iron-dependent peroxidase